MFNKLFNYLTLFCFSVIILMMAILSFSLLVYPVNVYIAVILSLVLVFGLSFYLNKLRKKYLS